MKPLILGTRFEGDTLIQERLRADGRIETRSNIKTVVALNGPVTVMAGGHTSKWNAGTMTVSREVVDVD
jgi:hypothetical protein